MDVGPAAAAGPAPPWAQVLHRWSGSVAFIITLPVAFSCIWALGFQTYSLRVVVHGLCGCLFYGAYAAKMLGLRLKGLRGGPFPYWAAAYWPCWSVCG